MDVFQLLTSKILFQISRLSVCQYVCPSVILSFHPKFSLYSTLCSFAAPKGLVITCVAVTFQYMDKISLFYNLDIASAQKSSGNLKRIDYCTIHYKDSHYLVFTLYSESLKNSRSPIIGLVDWFCSMNLKKKLIGSNVVSKQKLLAFDYSKINLQWWLSYEIPYKIHQNLYRLVLGTSTFS